MFKKGIFFFILLIVFCLTASAVLAQDGALDIIVSVNSPDGETVPNADTDVLEFNMLVSSLGPIVIDSLELVENYTDSTALNYRLYQQINNVWTLLSDISAPSSGVVEFVDLNLTIEANGYEMFMVKADTTNTENDYRLNIQAITLSQGITIDQFPLHGGILNFPESPNYDGTLTVEFLANSAEGRQDQGVTNVLNVLLTSDTDYRTNNTRITSVKYREVVWADANSYTLQTMNNTLGANVEAVNGVVTFSGLNLSMSTDTIPLWLNANTEDTINEYRIDLIEITTDRNINITGLPVQGNELGFYTRLNGISTSESPEGNVLKSDKTTLIKTGVEAQGRDAVINAVMFKELISNNNIDSVKLIRSDQPTNIIMAVAPSGGLIQFTNLSIPIADGERIYFEVIADTNEAIGEYQLQLEQVHITETSETFSEYYWFPVIGDVINIVSDVNPQLTASLSSDTPTGSTAPASRTNLLKFTLTATEGVVDINKIKVKQNPSSAQATGYRLVDVTDNIVLSDNVNPSNGYTEFTGFDNRNTGGVKTYLISANIREIDDFIQLELVEIGVAQETTIKNVPLLGKTVTVTEVTSDDNDDTDDDSDTDIPELTPTLTASLASSSPSGSKTPKANDLLMTVNLTAEDNDVTLTSLLFKAEYADVNMADYQLGELGSSGHISGGVVSGDLIEFTLSGADYIISQGQTKTLEVKANSNQAKGEYRLKLVNFSVGDAYKQGIPLTGGLLSYAQGTTTQPPPPSVPPEEQQPVSDMEAKYRERIRELQYQINDLEQQVISMEKQQLQPIDLNMVQRTKGKILLQVENNGEAWYVDPEVGKKFYLKDGESAYVALNAFGLGIANEDISKIPVGLENRFQLSDKDGDGLADKLEEALGTDPNKYDSDGDGYSDGGEVKADYDPRQGAGAKYSYDLNLANRLKGKILLQVQGRGEAWYINPADGKRYYLKDGELAYQIMRYLSLGITNTDLRKIPVGELF
ncbi:hypothetical protein ACFL2U_03315 [Patescibacteria group bacterium]